MNTYKIMKHHVFIPGLFIEACEIFKDKWQSHISESLYTVIDYANDYI